MQNSADFHDLGKEPRPDADIPAGGWDPEPFPAADPRPAPDTGEGHDPIGWGLAAAFALHVALAGVMLLVPAPRPPRSPRDPSIAVTILTPEQFAGIAPPRLAPETDEAAAPPGAAAMPADAGSMVQAKRFYSGGLLADPRSRRAREALPHLEREERIIQLCNIEALEQIHTADAARFDPDIVVAYAMAEVRLLDHGMAADGGAFRSAGRWYQVRYRCTLSPDLGSVAAFALRIGTPIPERDWASHDLAAGTAGAD